MRGNAISKVDKDVLRILLSPQRKVTSRAIAKNLNIPATTVQRHKRHLESELLTTTYNLDLKKFGWHKVQFFVASERGKTDVVAKKLDELDEVVCIEKSIGQQTIDLHVHAILKDNEDILRIMELIKSMPGVKDAVWSEIVQVVSRKSSVPLHVIEKL